MGTIDTTETRTSIDLAATNLEQSVTQSTVGLTDLGLIDLTSEVASQNGILSIDWINNPKNRKNSFAYTQPYTVVTLRSDVLKRITEAQKMLTRVIPGAQLLILQPQDKAQISHYNDGQTFQLMIILDGDLLKLECIMLDMRRSNLPFCRCSYTGNISKQARKRRAFLSILMTEFSFAPHDVLWIFSYGEGSTTWDKWIDEQLNPIFFAYGVPIKPKRQIQYTPLINEKNVFLNLLKSAKDAKLIVDEVPTRV